MSSLGVNPTIVLAAFVVSLVLAVIVITTVDKMRSQKGGEVDSPKKAKKDKKQEVPRDLLRKTAQQLLAKLVMRRVQRSLQISI